MIDGKTAARIVDTEIASRRMSKAEFHEKSGVSSATLSQWRTGKYDPTSEKLSQIEKCLEISFEDYEKSDKDDELMELLELIRTRPDLDVLLRSARNAPPSSVYAVVSQLEKERERNL